MIQQEISATRLKNKSKTYNVQKTALKLAVPFVFYITHKIRSPKYSVGSSLGILKTLIILVSCLESIDISTARHKYRFISVWLVSGFKQ